MNLQELKKLLADKNINLNDSQLQQLHQYAELLIEYNQKMNLTSIVEYSDILAKHFYDSLIPFSLVNFKEKESLADVGTGAGFPGLVLKIAYPFLNICLIEPTLKRCNFLNVVIEKLQLKDIKVLNKRAEDLNNLRSCFDYVTARAVSNLNVLSELCAPLLKINGKFVILRGKDGLNELKNAESAFKTLNLKHLITESMHYQENTRVNSVYQLEKNISNKYPRNYGTIKNKPL